MSVPHEEFDDPALKEAVRKCWACDCASEHLRQRVAGLLVQDTRMNIGPLGWTRRSWMIWPVAVAAALIISVALFDRYHTNPSVLAEAASILPVGLETDLIHTHDQCCKDPNHQHLAVSRDDDVAIASALRARLKQPVLVYHPKDADWKFRGASVCPVGSANSGHLVFIKGNDALSIFSLPMSVFPGAIEGHQYSATVDQHYIVGFVKAGALFCLVESGSGNDVSVDQLQQMSQQMKPAVARLHEEKKQSVQLAELLQPVDR